MGQDNGFYDRREAYGPQDSAGDSDNNGIQTSVHMPASVSTITSPPPYVDVLIIMKSFSNGDMIVEYDGTVGKICSGTPPPAAQQTFDLPAISSASAASAAAAAQTGAPTNTGSPSDSVSYGSLSSMSETISPSSTKPTSGVASGWGFPSSSTMSPTDNHPTPDPDSSSPSQSSSPNPHSSHPPFGAIVVVPLAIIACFVAAFLIWRRKRKARRLGAGMTQEMKMTRSPEEGLPQYTPTADGNSIPLMTSAAGGLVPTTTGTNSSLTPTTSAAPSAPGATGAEAAQPVILNSNMGSAYFTGIDTSDAMSMRSNPNNVPGNRMSYDARSMNSSDEPPPPYRPRSVPPISRETSLRQPNAPNNIGQMLAPLSEANQSSYEIEDFRVADGLRNPFDGGTPSGGGTPIGDGLNNPFDDPDDASISDGGSTPVSPLVETSEEGHRAMGGHL